MSQPVQTHIHEIKEGIARDIGLLRLFAKQLNYCRGYENVLSALQFLGKHTRSLRFILRTNPKKEIEQSCDTIETLIKEAKDVVSDSIGNPAGRYKAINRLVDLKDRFEELSDILTEFQQTTSGGNAAQEKPARTKPPSPYYSANQRRIFPCCKTMIVDSRGQDLSL